MNKETTTDDQETIELVGVIKIKMQNSLRNLIVAIFLAPFLVIFSQAQFGQVDIMLYCVYVLVSMLYLATLFFIFRINYIVNSLPEALFRIVVSTLPILALYIVYKSSLDSEEFIKSKIR